MKKRLLVLLLALLMMLSVAAPALAEEEAEAEAAAEVAAVSFDGVQLLDTFTVEALTDLIENGFLKPYFVKEGGALLEGGRVDYVGRIYADKSLTANELVLYDEAAGIFYLIRPVLTSGGAIVMQVVGEGDIDLRDLSETEVFLSVNGWSPQSVLDEIRFKVPEVK